MELWGGVECTVNRVGDVYYDQMERSGHVRRLSDLDLIAALGIRRLRYPVLWERIAPRSLSEFDWSWSDQRLNRLRELHISPIAGLVHHGSGPTYATIGEPEFADGLAAFAGSVARRYPWIDAYTPVNEPLTTARFCGLYGHWFPHRLHNPSFVRMVVNEARATVLAMRAIRTVNPRAQLVQTDDAGTTRSTPRLAYQAEFDNHRRWLAWDLLFGRVNRQHPLWRYLLHHGASADELLWFCDQPPPDVVGLNHYVTSDRYLDERLERYPESCWGGNGRDQYADVEAVRALNDWPGHMSIIREAWSRYAKPIAITEAHLGCTREEQMRWLRDTWASAGAALTEGADVRAVTVWGLFGLYDWDSRVTALNGHYEPGAYDVRGPAPRLTALGQLVAELSSGAEPSHPALAGHGWWKRDSRFLATPAEARRDATARTTLRRSSKSAGRPLLITGARGTLGAAFVRLCEQRGLAYRACSRADLDIADAGAVADWLTRCSPWAVVNAAGYVRVDAAQGDSEACYRANTVGAANLANACAAAGVRLLTYSTDLVFDGTKGSPYLEDDRPNPLSVYGATKRGGESMVLAAFHHALVVRTSAFFGPWDRYNFLTMGLDTLSRRGRWSAADDQRVSPTYVPDLVNASLDLLIDGESGLWHLANAGSVTWKDFALMAANAAGLDASLVIDASREEDQDAAPRPAYSVLGSAHGQILAPLDDALARFLRERRNDPASAGTAGRGVTGATNNGNELP